MVFNAQELIDRKAKKRELKLHLVRWYYFASSIFLVIIALWGLFFSENLSEAFTNFLIATPIAASIIWGSVLFKKKNIIGYYIFFAVTILQIFAIYSSPLVYFFRFSTLHIAYHYPAEKVRLLFNIGVESIFTFSNGDLGEWAFYIHPISILILMLLIKRRPEFSKASRESNLI